MSSRRSGRASNAARTQPRATRSCSGPKKKRASSGQRRSSRTDARSPVACDPMLEHAARTRGRRSRERQSNEAAAARRDARTSREVGLTPSRRVAQNRWGSRSAYCLAPTARAAAARLKHGTRREGLATDAKALGCGDAYAATVLQRAPRAKRRRQAPMSQLTSVAARLLHRAAIGYTAKDAEEMHVYRRNAKQNGCGDVVAAILLSGSSCPAR